MAEKKATTEAVDADGYRIGDPGAFARNMVKVGTQSQQLIRDFMQRQTDKSRSGEPRDPLNLTGTFTELLRSMVADPAVVMEAQFQLWRDYMNLWDRTARRMMGSDVEPVVAPSAGDKRFKDKDWQENQVFEFIKQSYLLTANWMQDTVAKVDG
jgi:polyhydroxyalkanoate synthase